MDDRKLIQLVKQNDSLYNKRSPVFKNRTKRMAIWEHVAMEMDVPVDQCMKRWTTLRDRYSKECRLISDLSKSGETPKNCWPYVNAMHFVKPYIIGRLSRRAPLFQSPNTDPLCLPVEHTQVKRHVSPTDAIDSQAPSVAECVTKNSPTASIASRESSLPASPAPGSTPLVLEKKRKDDIDDLFYEAFKTFKKIRVAREIKAGNACIKGFGDMIVAAISGMSERKQTKAMQKAIDIVMSIKMQPDD